MRIVAGQYGRRKLEVPQSKNIRPTSDKVRGAIFNALEAAGALQGARALDCFCGTGALGLEALSRGAAFCSFMDKDRGALALARRNAQNLGAVGQSEFILRDVTGLGGTEKLQKYSLLFLDPPYRKGILDFVLKELSWNLYLQDAAVCVLESEKGYEPYLDASFKVQSIKNYGDTQVHFLVYNGL